MIEALKNPAINVRYQAFVNLKEQGETVVGAVKGLLTSQNPYHQARAIWLLSQTGERGRDEVEPLLENKNELVRATAFRALRLTDEDILPLAERLSMDPSPFVRREVAIALRDLPPEKTKPILLKLIASYDGNDKWYLEAVASGLSGHEESIVPEIRKIYKGDSLRADQWDKRLASLVGRLHPSSSISDLKIRASSASLTERERSEALTALSFVNTRPAARSMIELTRSPLKDVAEKARYWVSFRQSNDWFSLLDWSKTGIDTEHERKLASMKVKKSKV